MLLTITLIFTHYLNALAAVAVAGCYLLLPQYRNRETSVRLLLVAATALVCGAYILTMANPFSVEGIPDDATSGIERTVTLIWWHLQGLGSFEFVPLLLMPLLFVPGYIKESGIPRDWIGSAQMLLVMLLVGLLVTALASPRPRPHRQGRRDGLNKETK